MKRQIERLTGAAAPDLEMLTKFVDAIDAGNPVQAADYSDLPIVSDRLNDLEKKLFNEDPIVGARVLLHANTATKATTTLYTNSPAVLHNGNGDAFRHMYWNFRMASDGGVDQSWAERWATAHEDGSTGQPSVERMMDLYNNNRGRQMAADNVDDMPSALRAAVRNGSCRICPNGTLIRSDSMGEL